MDKRLKLSSMIKEATGVNRVYFAPETKNNMTYPCIRYELSDRNAVRADNDRYLKYSIYTITYITRSPSDSIKICDGLESLRYSEFVRTYVNDGLYHYVYSITL